MFEMNSLNLEALGDSHTASNGAAFQRRLPLSLPSKRCDPSRPNTRGNRIDQALGYYGDPEESEYDV